MKVILGIKLYNLTEVSELLGVRKPTISQYIRDGKLKAQTIAGMKYVSEDGLRDFLMSKEEAQ